jgi:predicted nuclease with TOPRIM domain
MKKQLEQRLQQLKAEFESGQKVLADLESKQVNVHETLLRIQGAIQVLEEELASYNGASSEPETVELLEKELQIG